ncbi:nitroreductase family protein [Bacillus sp. AGMB 02131]|uniref:Nitroreductase family protein n=1 Tax=Peribacillus faecalis TaxID=2772559 RepID=A0A927CSA3_9BACI|nr:nitroreductase family protein [Peribacillus faecalis]MBD3106967.1 nitroreductase family protein [Peribacillus faecalis]
MITRDFYTAIKERRSIYGITKQSPISDEKIQEIIEFAVMHAPSAYNSQNTRAVLLLGEQSDKFWDITKETLRKIVSADAFPDTEAKMNMFKAGYGTVLFFEDMDIVKSLQEQFPSYADNFPVYSSQTLGSVQFIVWAALEAEGFGATLQHYQPLVDDEVKKEWDIPDYWKLVAQMPFGVPSAPAGEKQFAPIEDRVKVYR